MKILIIGAGVAGLSIGWRLAQAGAETIILERAQPGRAATWASAGMLAATAETGQAPEAEVAFARSAMGLWPEFAAELEQQSGRAVRYRKEGALLVARDEAESELLKARAALAGVAFIGADAVRAKVPGLTTEICGALWATDEAQVDNRALGLALAMAFLRAGGALQANEAAVRIEEWRGGRVGVRTPFRFHEADAVVLAAGAWSSQIEGLPPKMVPPVRPVKGEMIALSVPDGAALPAPLVWGNHVYLVPRGKQLFVGATVKDCGYDTTLSDAARAWLQAQASGLIPGLAQWEVAEHWAGLRPGSPDGQPILGPSGMDNVYIASGQYRNGILLAPALAEAARSLVLERSVPPHIAAFDPRRFQNETSLAARDGVQ